MTLQHYIPHSIQGTQLSHVFSIGPQMRAANSYFPSCAAVQMRKIFLLWLFENGTPELQGACPAPFAEFFEDRSKNNYRVMAPASICERVLTLTLHNHSRKAPKH